MKYRVDLDFVGLGGAAQAYGGHLNAWSFRDIEGRKWFAEFRQTALDAIRTRYLPIYRMADGEYRFLMGRRFNFNRKPLWKEILAVTAEKIRIKNPDRWATSWGETYPPEMTRRLRGQLIERVRLIAESGFLACYINDNGLHAFTEHNPCLIPFFEKHGIRFDASNYVPFHFAPSLFIAEGWQDFIVNRSILVVTGGTKERFVRIERSLLALGARKALFLPISSTSSMTDLLDISNALRENPDICLVAAGIGAAQITSQLRPTNSLVVDVGGFMNCLENPDGMQHGGVVGYPRQCGF